MWSSNKGKCENEQILDEYFSMIYLVSQCCVVLDFCFSFNFLYGGMVIISIFKNMSGSARLRQIKIHKFELFHEENVY